MDKSRAETKNKSQQKDILAGIQNAIPVVFGYITIGFAFGVLASNAGLSLLQAVCMSLIVYAGSAQLISVGLFAAGVQPLSIVSTTFIVNIRHMLMAAAMSPYLKEWSGLEKTVFGLELTDETFALHSTVFSEENVNKRSAFASNITSQASWILGSALGALLGEQLGDISQLGLDFALPAMFIALLIVQLKSKTHLMVALIAGGLSLSFYLFGIDQWNVILAASAAALIGVVIKLCTQK